MKLLLTGAGGQVGKEVSKQAANVGFHLYSFSKAELDITDSKELHTVFQTYQPTVVINAAAYTSVDGAEKESDKAYAVNRDGVINLANACKSQGIPLIHISTDFVFDGEKQQPYNEEDAPSPLNVYGHSKWAGEKALRQVWERHIIVRVSWVFSYWGSNFVKTILRLSKTQREISVVDDQIGCPTAASDIAVALLDIARNLHKDKVEWGTYHYCGDKAVTRFEFAKRIIEFASKKDTIPQVIPVRSSHYATNVKRPKNSVLQVDKLTKFFDILPSDWENALKKTVLELCHSREGGNCSP